MCKNVLWNSGNLLSYFCKLDLVQNPLCCQFMLIIKKIRGVNNWLDLTIYSNQNFIKKIVFQLTLLLFGSYLSQISKLTSQSWLGFNLVIWIWFDLILTNKVEVDMKLLDFDLWIWFLFEFNSKYTSKWVRYRLVGLVLS